ncbi:MAG: hypothetical protein ABEJ96_11755, partial [Thiohalorhabdaceae bacterium]
MSTGGVKGAGARRYPQMTQVNTDNGRASALPRIKPKLGFRHRFFASHLWPSAPSADNAVVFAVSPHPS